MGSLLSRLAKTCFRTASSRALSAKIGTGFGVAVAQVWPRAWLPSALRAAECAGLAGGGVAGFGGVAAVGLAAGGVAAGGDVAGLASGVLTGLRRALLQEPSQALSEQAEAGGAAGLVSAAEADRARQARRSNPGFMSQKSIEDHSIRRLPLATFVFLPSIQVMISITVILEVEPTRLAEFEKAITTNAAASREEPGCLRFEVSRHLEKPNVFALSELYQDRDAVGSPLRQRSLRPVEGGSHRGPDFESHFRCAAR